MNRFDSARAPGIGSRWWALPLVGVLACAAARPAAALTVVQDGFESGGFGPEWDLTAGVAITNGGGATGTIYFAHLLTYTNATGRDLGARFSDAAPLGARDFYLDCFFRVQTTTQRQFNVHVSDSTGAVGSGAPSVNLRYQAGWAAYAAGAWHPIPGLGAVTDGAWHRLRLTGRDWGQAGARYDLELSDAGGANFTSAATNLAWYQNGNPSNNTARYFAFTTVYGNSPGFDVDEVVAEVTAAPVLETDAVLRISGTYPHLAVFSADGECGMGAVAPWADRLWFVTYPPHAPGASADKLWTVNTNLVLTARPESVGGTHANRLVHRESQQLVIGPHFVDATGGVRTVSRTAMPGRLTATARHLTDPSNKVYFATMEEGLYEVDVRTLAVATNYPDVQGAGDAHLPGSHGKGAYTGQGRIVYANNGESGWSIAADPNFNGPAGVLAENAGANWASGWSVVERKNFCEVTGPGGIYGNDRTNDPIWCTGWDKRSVLLKLLDGGTWRTFRLPKGSYSHDALFGWYTEWPRIREVTEGRRLMHMHGLFYDFPPAFSAAATAGIRPLCSYLRMPVDYCAWNGELVMTRDDASTTGGNTWAGQSHSAPWFGRLADLETWGPAAGFGGPWLNDAATAGTASDPFFVAGFRHRVLHLRHTNAAPLQVTVEYDDTGAGAWKTHAVVTVPAAGYAWHLLPPSLPAIWVRLTPDADAGRVTAYFHLGNPPRAADPALFAGLAGVGATNAWADGILRPQEGNARTLQFAATRYADGGAFAATAYYEIGGSLQLRRATNATFETALRSTYSLSNAAFTVDAASVLVLEGTNRFRLPRTHPAYDRATATGWPRGKREVVTERDLFQAHGTFYELPKSGSGGFRKLRPFASHALRISDFASWRGLLALAGVAGNAATNGHVFRADDGQAALWFGNVDDLWRLGPPRGFGGPWSNTAVSAGVASDPYLMFGYDFKVLTLAHDQPTSVTFSVEVDFAANNTWSEYASLEVPAGQNLTHVFPDGYSVHWVRLKSDAQATATAIFTYGAPTRLVGASPRPGGAVRVEVGGEAGLPFTLLSTTNIHPPDALWLAVTAGVLGVTSTPYDDAQAPARARAFYRATTP